MVMMFLSLFLSLQSPVKTNSEETHCVRQTLSDLRVKLTAKDWIAAEMQQQSQQ